MAQVTKVPTQESVTPAAPVETCPQDANCVQHVCRTVKVEVSEGRVEEFQFKVHFHTMREVLIAAGESVGRKVQSFVRNAEKKGTTQFPLGRIVDITPSVEFTRTKEDLLQELRAMSVEELEQQFLKQEETLKMLQFLRAERKN